MTCDREQGFSLVEILIVVMTLAILAALVVPQFGDTSEAARFSSAVENLKQLRASIDLYKNQHLGKLPGVAGADPDVVFVEQLSRPTNIDGDRSPNPDEGFDDPDYPLGPYISYVISPNPFNGSRRVRTVSTFPGAAPGGSGSSTPGWIYEITSGRIKINTSGVAPDGQLYWNL